MSSEFAGSLGSILVLRTQVINLSTSFNAASPRVVIASMDCPAL